METSKVDLDIAMLACDCYRISLRDGVCCGKTLNPTCFQSQAERVCTVLRGDIMVRVIVLCGRREIEVEAVDRTEGVWWMDRKVVDCTPINSYTFNAD